MNGSGVIVTLTAVPGRLPANLIGGQAPAWAVEQSTLLKRLPTLDEVAETAAFVASDRAGAMTATVVNLSAGGIAE
jgi:NAD(P)-dependent dehydrogenase (short-subunit alcohol dehydrogenase family)